MPLYRPWSLILDNLLWNAELWIFKPFLFSLGRPLFKKKKKILIFPCSKQPFRSRYNMYLSVCWNCFYSWPGFLATLPSLHSLVILCWRAALTWERNNSCVNQEDAVNLLRIQSLVPLKLCVLCCCKIKDCIIHTQLDFMYCAPTDYHYAHVGGQTKGPHTLVRLLGRIRCVLRSPAVYQEPPMYNL